MDLELMVLIATSCSGIISLNDTSHGLEDFTSTWRIAIEKLAMQITDTNKRQTAIAMIKNSSDQI